LLAQPLEMTCRCIRCAELNDPLNLMRRMNRDFSITDGLMRIRARNNDSITVATGDSYKHIA
jgi:hypothetical protein